MDAIPEKNEETIELSTLSTIEKCQHKAWKARLSGYEEATMLFQIISDSKSPVYSGYLELVRKFVLDSNVVARERGLEATLAFVENAFQAGTIASEVCDAIICKCLNQRAKTKNLGVAILMAYIKAEKQEIVQEALLKGLTKKQPKIVAACVVAFKEALRTFGTKTIYVEPILKHLKALLQDRDKTVRDETKSLSLEIYRWVGPALDPLFAQLKPVQMSFLRSQQSSAAAERAAVGKAMDRGGPEEVEVCKVLDDVEILSKLPKEFSNKIKEKNWRDRKEALEAVQVLVENPKLEQGDYYELVKALMRVLSEDTNVFLIMRAAKCIGLIAAGLQENFSQYSVSCIKLLVEKFRVKKPSLIQVLKETIDACFAATTLEGISEVCITALNHKNPSVKAETASFLARCFRRCTPDTLPKKLLELFVNDLLKLTSNPVLKVRNSAFIALGTAMIFVSKKEFTPFLDRLALDAFKIYKINCYFENAVKLGKENVKPTAAGDAAASKTTSAVAKAGPPANSASKPAAKKVCINKFKENLIICARCGRDMENGANAFLASIDGESSKDFCGHACLVKYEHSKKKGEGDIEIIEAPVGSGPKQKAASHTMSKKQRIITCTWCQAKKSNFDMIERLDVNNKSQLFCTLDCLSLYRVHLQANSNQSVTCDQCPKYAPAQYHLTMSDASVRNFCSHNCLMSFEGKFVQPSAATATQPTPSQQFTQNKAHARSSSSTPAAATPKASPYGTRHSTRGATSKQTPSQAPTTSTTGTSAASTTAMTVISNIVSLAPPDKGS